MVYLCRRGQEERVRSQELTDGATLGPLDGAKLHPIAVALEQQRRTAMGVADRPLFEHPLTGEGEAILMPHPFEDKLDLEPRRRLLAGRIEPKRNLHHVR